MKKDYTVITGASSGIGYATHPNLEVIIKVSDLSQTENCLSLYEENSYIKWNNLKSL